MSETIAFVGGGNMAVALIGGLVAAGWHAEHVRCAVRTQESVARLRALHGIAAGTEVQTAVAGADIVVLAVKPQQLSAALAGVRLAAGATLVSVAAGVRITTLQRWLGSAVEIIRTMPNTPALVRKGITGLYAPPGTTPQARHRAETLMRAVGGVVWVDSEPALDAVTALSGSGPAYFFAFVEALREAGTALGLPAEVAAQLALETFTGAAALAASGDTDVAELRSQVTSKGGTTEAALQQLAAGDLPGLLREALAAAARRATERADAAEAEALATGTA